MAGWPITLGLLPGGPRSFLLTGLGRQSLPTASRRRMIVPIYPSGYAGRDFSRLSTDADDVFAIDLNPALDDGDSLMTQTLAAVFYPVDATAAGFQTALDGGPMLLGAVAAQAINRPPAARYLLGFTCDTALGRRIAIHSFFNATARPHEFD